LHKVASVEPETKLLTQVSSDTPHSFSSGLITASF
jgi:hypothetical protein